MKKRTKLIALLAAMALCLGLFAGCSNKTDDNAETENTADSFTTQYSVTDDANVPDTNAGNESETDGNDVAESTDIVAEVLALTEGGLDLQLYDPISADTVIEDYATVDFSLYEAVAENIYEYTFDDSAIIFLSEDGILVETSVDEINQGDRLVFYLTEEGQTAIVVYHPVIEDTAETTDNTDITE